jgi:hypothetical protein
MVSRIDLGRFWSRHDPNPMRSIALIALFPNSVELEKISKIEKTRYLNFIGYAAVSIALFSAPGSNNNCPCISGQGKGTETIIILSIIRIWFIIKGENFGGQGFVFLMGRMRGYAKD